MCLSCGKIKLWLTFFSLITELYTHPCLSVCLCSVSLIFSSRTPFQVSSLFTIVYSHFPQEGVDSTKRRGDKKEYFPKTLEIKYWKAERKCLVMETN